MGYKFGSSVDMQFCYWVVVKISSRASVPKKFFECPPAYIATSFFTHAHQMQSTIIN